MKKKSITELEKSEEALRKSEQRFRRLIEASSQVVWLANAQGDIMEDSPSWRSFTGQTYKQLAGWNWLNSVHPDDRKQLEKSWKNSIKKAIPNHVEFRQLNARGEYRNILGTAVPIFDNEGRVLEWIGMNIDITKRKNAEEALRHEKEFSENILKTMPDGLDIIDENNNILYMNKALINEFGKNNIGKKCYEIYKTDKKQCANCPLKIPLNGDTKQLEVSGIKNGRTFLISHTSIMMDGKKCVLEIFSDITERKKMEEQLAISNRALREALIRVRALFANIGEGIIAVDTNGKIIALNKMVEVISGLKTNNLLGKSLFSAFKLEDNKGQLIPKSLNPVNLALESGKVVRGTYFLKKNGSSSLPLSMTSSPVALDGEIIEGVTIFRDFSEQINIDKTKDEFVFTVSHELRTPLSAMSWIIERLFEEKEQMPEKLKKYLGETYNQTQRMLEMTNNLLNATKIELGVFSYKYEDVNLKDSVAEIISEFENKISDKKIDFKSVLSKDINVRKIHSSAIPIILRNLISNAIKFTPVGGKINLKISKIENQLAIAVSDSGVGIAKPDQSKIFQKLYRGQNAKGKFEGSGLGLYIIKGIVDHVGGKIVVKSQKRKGTTFTITLPFGGGS